MGILAIIGLLIQVLPAILEATGVVSPAIGTLIQNLCAALPAQIAAVLQQTGTTDQMAAILQDFRLTLDAMSKDLSLPAETVATIDALSDGITVALAEWEKGSTTCDPSNLGGLPTSLTPTPS